MMDKMRAASKTWVAAILIGFLILSFAIWGINDIFTGGATTTLAKVGDSELDVRTFESEFSLRTRRQITAAGTPMTIQEARDIGYDRVVLNDLIRDMAVLNEAKRLGLGASDAMVRQALMDIPGLASNGRVDPNIFQRFLQQIQMTEGQLVQMLRENLVRDQLTRTAMVGAPAPRGMAIALGAHATERRTVEYIVFPPDRAGEIKAPDDAALEAYMQANAVLYTAPEMRTVTALLIDARDIAAKIDVADAEIASEYEVRRATYETLETRELAQISFPTKEDAETGRKAIEDGKSFEELATERGFTSDDIGLGLVSKGDATVPAGAFEIADGEVTQPLEGPFGWVLIKVLKINPGSLKPLDEVKDELRQAISLEHALVNINELLGQIEDAIAAADSLESVPGLLGDDIPAKTVTFAPINAVGLDDDGKPVAGLPDGPAFLNDVFQAEPGDIGPLSETPAHVLYVIRVDQIAPPALKSLAAHRDEVAADWTAAETAKAIAAVAAGAEERSAASGATIEAVAAELGLEAKTSAPLARDEAVPDLSPSLIARLFASPRGTWLSGAGEPPRAVLARVKEVSTAASDDPRAAEREARGDVTREIASELATSYEEAIVRATKIEINEDLFTQLKTRQQ